MNLLKHYFLIKFNLLYSARTIADFPFGFGLFLFNRINTKRFVPPTDLIGLKKLILHIFSNQVAAFLAFYPFYFCIFWENIFYIQEEGMFASSFWNMYHRMFLEYNMLYTYEEYYFTWHHQSTQQRNIELWYQMKAYFSKLNVFSI